MKERHDAVPLDMAKWGGDGGFVEKALLVLNEVLADSQRLWGQVECIQLLGRILPRYVWHERSRGWVVDTSVIIVPDAMVFDVSEQWNGEKHTLSAVHVFPGEIDDCGIQKLDQKYWFLMNGFNTRWAFEDTRLWVWVLEEQVQRLSRVPRWIEVVGV